MEGIDNAIYHPDFKASTYYTHQYTEGNSTIGINANSIYYHPIYIPIATTFTKIGLEVTTTTGAGNARLGLYQSAFGVPSKLILDCGTVSLAANAVVEVSTTLTVSPAVYRSGLYFIACVTNATPTVRAQALRGQNLLGCNSSGASSTTMYTESFTYAALPTTPSPSANASTAVPRFWIRL